MSAWDEAIRLTKMIFGEIYAKDFSNRKSFDAFVTCLINEIKLKNMKYSYTSSYFDDQFMFHVNIVYIDPRGYGTGAMTTFNFPMIWDDSGFNSSHMDNISTFLGTPMYMFNRDEKTTKQFNIQHEIRTEL
jgi:hypothetical protein